MTEEIRFQWWLGVAHTGLTSVDGPTAVFVDSSNCLQTPETILHCFVISSSPQVFTDRIVRMVRFRLFYCQIAIRRVSLSLWARVRRSACSRPALRTVQVCVCFLKNELPQQAGGVSFPPGLLFEAVR